MDLQKELKHIEEAEKALHKKIDDEVTLEKEIDEVAKFTAKQLANKPMVPFSIQGEDYFIIAAVQNLGNVMKIELVARKVDKLVTPNSKVIRANLEVDPEYTKEENLIAGIKAILGHITGCIKPEVLD